MTEFKVFDTSLLAAGQFINYIFIQIKRKTSGYRFASNLLILYKNLYFWIKM